MSKEELLKGLSPEQIEKARACHSEEELLELAKEEGIELTEEQLASVSGGCTVRNDPRDHQNCPQCGSSDTSCISYNRSAGFAEHQCAECRFIWRVE